MAVQETAQVLPDQVAELQKQLRDKEMAEVTARAEALRKTQESAAALQAARVKAECENAIEETRKGAWITHLLSTARPDSPVDAAAMMASIPKFNWPPNDGPENYSFPGMPADKQIEDIGSTWLAKLAQERGLKF
jgi:hypothetical protein